MSSKQQVQYYLDKQGRFVIEQYNRSKPFASFFPGIAGPHGIPMWAFYVNRGQCVCSMGIRDKEQPIMEFLSANRAYQLASNQGFRTLVKITRGKETEYYEPFQEQLIDVNMDRTQRMIISSAELTIEEENRTLGLRFSVDYCNVPEDEFAGLIRVLKIENLQKSAVKVEVLDGLPLIIPFGVDNVNLKSMRFLVQSFVETVNYDTKVPFYKGKVKQEDKPEIIKIKEGNFYAGFRSTGRGSKLVKPVIDPEAIWGAITDYGCPEEFLAATPYRIPSRQRTGNCLPCAMGHYQADIAGGAVDTYYTIIGHAGSVDELNRLVPRITRPSYIEDRQQVNQRVISQVTQKGFTCSSTPEFDMYCRQNFMDNVLRGGLPISFESSRGERTTLHLYSRKHGDLERDYNDYRLSPTNYSQGNGNYRDINQNRRSDLLVNPDVRSDNVEHFYNLIQLDGFNPLGVKTTSFCISDRKAMNAVLKKAVEPEQAATVRGLLEGRFMPGELFEGIRTAGIELNMPADEFLGELLAACSKHQETDYGHSYWTDHWTYNLDLLENYLAVYPEKLEWILFENRHFSFFDNPHVVRPRADKYVLWDGNPMQLGSVAFDDEKEKRIRQRKGSPYEVRTRHGKGDIYQTTLTNKLLCLIVNKLASLDTAGVGVELEADKPNWYDALNGLPGLLGSSLSETLEIKRHILFLLQSFKDLKLKDSEHWPVAVEIKEFIDAMHRLLKKQLAGTGKMDDFTFWDKACTLKETYRERIYWGVNGDEADVRLGDLRDWLNLALKKLDRGIRKATDRKTGVPSTYFMTEVKEYKLLKEKNAAGKRVQKVNERGMPCFKPTKIRHKALPLFLEGPVHYLRIENSEARARRVVEGIRKSGLYDRKLKMYKVNENLSDQPMEIGRTRTFSRGWLENESIWMHMEYKYMLELLRSGLYKEFYEDFRNVLVPFMDPAVYGRSILENSSFIASSAYPDSNLHGNGFVARLSGSTAEFVHILALMTVGPRPFTIGRDGELQLQFEPVLPAWLFSSSKRNEKLWIGNEEQEFNFPANSFSFMFLGDILVTYRNSSRRATFGAKAAKVASIKLYDDVQGKSIEVEGETVNGPLAQMIRDRKFNRIEINLK